MELVMAMEQVVGWLGGFRQPRSRARHAMGLYGGWAMHTTELLGGVFLWQAGSLTIIAGAYEHTEHIMFPFLLFLLYTKRDT